MLAEETAKESGFFLANPLPPPLFFGPEEGVDFLAFTVPEAADPSGPD